jgi:hypothetical protein
VSASIVVSPNKEKIMWLASSKYLVNTTRMTLALCFLSGCALTEDTKRSSVNANVLEEMKQYVPIGTATIVNNSTAITHSWFIDAVRGAPIVCSAIPGLQNFNCVPVGPPMIPHPAPPGVRYIGLGVSGVVSNGIAMTHAWYIDQFSSNVFVCQALSDLQNGRCEQKAIQKQ